MTFNHEDTADLTQETFVKAFGHYPNLKKNLHFLLGYIELE